MTSPVKDEHKQETSLQQSWAGTLVSFFSGEEPEHKEQSSRRNSRGTEEPSLSPRSNGQNQRMSSGSDDAGLTGVTLPLPKESAWTHGSPLGTTGTTAGPDSSDGGEESPAKPKSARPSELTFESFPVKAETLPKELHEKAAVTLQHFARGRVRERTRLWALTEDAERSRCSIWRRSDDLGTRLTITAMDRASRRDGGHRKKVLQRGL